MEFIRTDKIKQTDIYQHYYRRLGSYLYLLLVIAQLTSCEQSNRNHVSCGRNLKKLHYTIAHAGFVIDILIADHWAKPTYQHLLVLSV